MKLLTGFIAGVFVIAIIALIAVKIAKVAFFLLLIMAITAACSVKTKSALAWVLAAALTAAAAFAVLVFFVNA